jgi:hypothetical protein
MGKVLPGLFSELSRKTAANPYFPCMMQFASLAAAQPGN